MTTDSKPRLVPSTRFALAAICFFGCMVTYSLRTNMSFAIVCMVKENKTVEAQPEVTLIGDKLANSTEHDGVKFDWNKETQGLILSAFFWGYLGSQVLGGMLASRFGGKRVIVATIFGASILTVLTPVFARTSPYLLVGLRAAIGFLQGATFPAMHTMWSVWGPPLELSVLTGVSYAGAQIGNVVTLPLSGFLCQYGFDGGWPSIFYILGVSGLVWCAVWMYMVTDRPSTHPRIDETERDYIVKAVEANMGKQTSKPPPTPWLKIFLSPAVWACWFGHFAGDWGAYTMLVSLPTFLKDVLKLDLSALGAISAIPYIAYFLVINVGGILADYIRSHQILGTLATRRAAMITALIGQAVFLVLSGYCKEGDHVLVILLLTAAMAVSGFQYSGFVVNYLDIAPPFSGTVMGIGNTISCLGGILSPMITGMLTPNGTQGEWQSVMWLTAGVLTAGAVLFTLLAQGEVQEWAKLKNTDDDDAESVPLKLTPQAAEA